MSVAITGMGIISSIGHNIEENYDALKQAKNGISILSNLETRHKNSIKVGEVKRNNAELMQQLRLPTSNNFGRTTILGLIAAQEAVKNAGITDIQTYKTGLIAATSVGGMDQTEKYYYDYLTSDAHRKYIAAHPAGESSQQIAMHLGISDYVTTISTACSSAANAIMLGARLIKAGFLDRVVVGGADCLSKFTINGFNTLMILSNNDCMPFDEHRTGLNLGEGAAFLVLESENIVKKHSKKVLARVSGYANANDAFHQTASSEYGDGATLAMQKALNVANLSPSDIHYINAHGTATPNNDLSEGRAIQRIFGEAVPPFSSTKAFTGHTLAAAGAIEAVYSILSLQYQTIFPNLNFKTPIKELGLKPVTQVQSHSMEHILSNSFGFGGNCSTLIFSKA